RYLALLLLFVALVVFWAFSLQGVTSLNFLARDHVDAPFDFSWFQSANPLYILILARPRSFHPAQVRHRPAAGGAELWRAGVCHRPSAGCRRAHRMVVAGAVLSA